MRDSVVVVLLVLSVFLVLMNQASALTHKSSFQPFIEREKTAFRPPGSPQPLLRAFLPVLPFLPRPTIRVLMVRPGMGLGDCIEDEYLPLINPLCDDKDVTFEVYLSSGSVGTLVDVCTASREMKFDAHGGWHFPEPEQKTGKAGDPDHIVALVKSLAEKKTPVDVLITRSAGTDAGVEAVRKLTSSFMETAAHDGQEPHDLSWVLLSGGEHDIEEFADLVAELSVAGQQAGAGSVLTEEGSGVKKCLARLKRVVITAHGVDPEHNKDKVVVHAHAMQIAEKTKHQGSIPVLSYVAPGPDSHGELISLGNYQHYRKPANMFRNRSEKMREHPLLPRYLKWAVLGHPRSWLASNEELEYKLPRRDDTSIDTDLRP